MKKENIVQNAPDKIYLQDYYGVFENQCDSLDTVEWCLEKGREQDIEYIQKDVLLEYICSEA